MSDEETLHTLLTCWPVTAGPLTNALWIGALAARGQPLELDDELVEMTERMLERWPPRAKA